MLRLIWNESVKLSLQIFILRQLFGHLDKFKKWFLGNKAK